jgi:hypothetical protein
MRKIIFLYCLIYLLQACSSKPDSVHPFASYFFPYNEEAKFYVYRDVVHGLNEKFYRVYGIEDSYGKHVVVETYANDGRITEAYNYNLDSLNIMDHMVVDRTGRKTKAILIKDKLLPFTQTNGTWFASKFPGPIDSTLILNEIKRSVHKTKPFQTKVMEESRNTISFTDTIRLTLFNPFTKNENELKDVFRSYFSEGIGLVRIHDLEMKTDYQLEKIISQEDFIKMIRR